MGVIVFKNGSRLNGTRLTVLGVKKHFCIKSKVRFGAVKLFNNNF